MDANNIAKSLLNRRNALNPVVMQGEMINTLTAEGLQEALQRRWLIPDLSSGYLIVSQDMAKVNEMNEMAAAAVAETAPTNESVITESAWTKPWAQPNASHDLAVRHSKRPLGEMLSPGTGHDPDQMPAPAATPTAAPAAPAAAPAASAPIAPALKVGENAVVAPKTESGGAQNQAFTGVISSINNGIVKIKFGGQEREFPAAEVQRVQQSAA